MILMLIPDLVLPSEPQMDPKALSMIDHPHPSTITSHHANDAVVVDTEGNEGMNARVIPQDRKNGFQNSNANSNELELLTLAEFDVGEGTLATRDVHHSEIMQGWKIRRVVVVVIHDRTPSFVVMVQVCRSALIYRSRTSAYKTACWWNTASRICMYKEYSVDILMK